MQSSGSVSRPLKRGWLYKLKGKEWTRQWMVLDSSGQLEAYETSRDEKPKDKANVGKNCKGIRCGNKLKTKQDPPAGVLGGRAAMMELDLWMDFDWVLCAGHPQEGRAWQDAILTATTRAEIVKAVESTKGSKMSSILGGKGGKSKKSKKSKKGKKDACCEFFPSHYYNPQRPCCYRCWGYGSGMIPVVASTCLMPWGWFWF